ncbi:hypothetical protein FRB96_001405 [Tulasnella sp. 330]|nr:hypothetical protein FRB96_001405 [Tulasnella sp. 330]
MAMAMPEDQELLLFPECAVNPEDLRLMAEAPIQARFSPLIDGAESSVVITEFGIKDDGSSSGGGI